MSFLTTNSKNEKKTALKLINKYADSYNTIILENKTLKLENKDLRSNLKINKEIIDGFFSNKTFKEKIESFIKSYKEENKNLYNQNLILSKELETINSKISFNKQIFSNSMMQIKEDNEKLKTKNFLNEQLILKKNSIIQHQKKKINELKDGYNFIDREIIICEPSKIVLEINEELQVYKQLYDNFTNLLKESKESLIKYEQIINDLQNENQNLRTQYKIYVFNSNRERDNLITTIKRERSHSNIKIKENGGALNLLRNYNKKNNNNKINNKNNNNNNNKIYLNTQKHEKNSLSLNIPKNNHKNSNNCGFEKLNTVDEKKLLNSLNDDRKFENEEFIEIMKTVGLNQMEFEKYGKNKNYQKLTDAIEMIFKLLKDKNLTISILEKENDNLTTKNFKLNKENMRLIKENLELKSEIHKKRPKNLNNFKFLKNNFNNNNNNNNLEKDDNSSLFNNTSQITINSKIQNQISNYQKLLQTQKKEILEISPNLKTEEANNDTDIIEEHDSIVYMKNIYEDENMEINNESNGTTKHIKNNNNNNENNNNSIIEEDSILSNKKDSKIEIKKIDPLLMTLGSVTSSEFKDKNFDSFLSTIKKDNLNGYINNNIKEDEKEFIDFSIKEFSK
jgi:hypothetical protein